MLTKKGPPLFSPSPALIASLWLQAEQRKNAHKRRQFTHRLPPICAVFETVCVGVAPIAPPSASVVIEPSKVTALSAPPLPQVSTPAGKSTRPLLYIGGGINLAAATTPHPSHHPSMWNICRVALPSRCQTILITTLFTEKTSAIRETPPSGMNFHKLKLATSCVRASCARAPSLDRSLAPLSQHRGLSSECHLKHYWHDKVKLSRCCAHKQAVLPGPSNSFYKGKPVVGQIITRVRYDWKLSTNPPISFAATLSEHITLL